jgi:hypothetical protein
MAIREEGRGRRPRSSCSAPGRVEGLCGRPPPGSRSGSASAGRFPPQGPCTLRRCLIHSLFVGPQIGKVEPLQQVNAPAEGVDSHEAAGRGLGSQPRWTWLRPWRGWSRTNTASSLARRGPTTRPSAKQIMAHGTPSRPSSGAGASGAGRVRARPSSSAWRSSSTAVAKESSTVSCARSSAANGASRTHWGQPLNAHGHGAGPFPACPPLTDLLDGGEVSRSGAAHRLCKGVESHLEGAEGSGQVLKEVCRAVQLHHVCVVGQ